MGSLAYRSNKEAIWNADPPLKYTRLLPYITGNRILEIGSAEGVLSLLLAPHRQKVVALELREERHRDAIALQAHYLEDLGLDVGRCQMVCGDIRGHAELFHGIETLVAIRSIYYLRDDAQSIIDAAFKAGVGKVVMCGNKNRAATYYSWCYVIGTDQCDHDPFMPYNYLASIDGMSQLLTTAGYKIETIVKEGDPIVVGRC